MGGIIADEDGDWEIPVPLFEEGEYTFSAAIVDRNDRVLSESAPVTFTVAAVTPVAQSLSVTNTPAATRTPTPVAQSLIVTSTPAATHTPSPTAPPAITAPRNGESLAAGTNTFTGTAAPGSTVQVADISGQVLATTTADAGGTWSADVELTQVGETSVIAQVVQPESGAVLAVSPPMTVLVIAPVAPQTGATDWSPSETARAVGVIVVALLLVAGAALLLVGSTLRASVADGLAQWLRLRSPRNRR
ncbi:MAG: Ig-like domain-containing protein [Anaerolineae bacterium]|nr:Ig-like domain-containing protein [Anaerolineae bacterium]